MTAASVPRKLVRIVEPIEGMPRVRVRASRAWGGRRGCRTRDRGSDHVRFEGFNSQLRLTTDIPLSYLAGSRSR